MPLTAASLIDRIERLSRFHRLGVWLVQAAIFALSGLAAFLLRFDGAIPAAHLRHLAWGLPAWIATKAVVFRLCGLDRGWWRFVSIDDVMRIGFGNVAASAVAYVVIRTFGPPGFPRSIYLLDLGICFLATAGVRILIRILRESRGHDRRGEAAKRVLIYGAGEAGVTLLRELRANPRLPYLPYGFLDGNPQKRGLVIHGLKVLGGGPDLREMVRRHQVETVLIAIPSASGAQMTRILHDCLGAGVAYKTVPGLAEVIEGNGLARQIRDVAVEDLLGRTPVRLDEDRIRDRLEGRVVLVTGAAGSIGSELCRQIARFAPAAIVGFDVAESPLFHLDGEMRRALPDVPFYAEIGSIQNCARVSEVFTQYAPSVVYHAAAYKHVPMMEAHVFEAIENNVFGTHNVAVAAADHAVDDFVLISSDKAVRPANVMGATKRLAELLVLALQNGRTRYTAVRFGNVLGSNGSVIPIFKRQIAAGGPVTVTHPEMRRFFMTVPEAVQLVLQASTMGGGGEIFVLDMGQPVKIVDLARNLILLSGLRPGEDIRIEFTGVRPGEKLYEELSTLLEDTLPTAHEKIRVFLGNGFEASTIGSCLSSFRRLCQSRDLGRLILLLKEIVPDYNPSAHLLRRLLGEPSPRGVVASA